ncbi:hypothetical protein [Novosphingobium mathurense]|uniref:Uncharacterized protein n=2 Tax=Novosphingobium TaxID=165696 RepID=A0A1U6IML9_9SPHN|nr:hypothetical protein [Novosphingobium mathurense]CDO38617.1 hypothetical protein SPHV1_640023 [Novosphingobium sp. KN65.2]SLK09212.1 hypothetical protein SAMN06295987_109105 [Novosphingobium mathurense]
MDLFDITSQRTVEAAARRLESLERFADRRDDFLATIDLDALDREAAYRIFAADEAVIVELALGHLYIAHLVDMDAMRAELCIH